MGKQKILRANILHARKGKKEIAPKSTTMDQLKPKQIKKKKKR